MDTATRKKWIARIFEISVVLATIGFTRVLAYEPEETHMPLTQLAVERSVVSSVGFLANLGLTDKYPFVNSKNETQDTHDLLILDGAHFEDTLTRVEGSASEPGLGSYGMFTHFYDPQNEGRGLDVLYEFGKPSISWAITDSGALYITPPLLNESSTYRES